jgi:hypothetical protein
LPQKIRKKQYNKEKEMLNLGENRNSGEFNDNNEMWSGLDAGHEAACHNAMDADEWDAATEEERAQHVKEQNELMRSDHRNDDPNHMDSRTEADKNHDDWCDKYLKA